MLGKHVWRIALPFTVCACAPEPALEGRFDLTSAIIDGDNCTESSFPSAMAMVVEGDFNLFGNSTRMAALACTATLIAPDVALTAAHCVDPSLLLAGLGTVENADYYVTFEADLSRLTGLFPETTDLPDSALLVAKTVAHPDFDIDELNAGVNGPGEFSDVALLFLAEPVDIEPAVVITAEEALQIEEEAEVDIVGWGQQTNTGSQFIPPPPGTLGEKVCARSMINELDVEEMQIGDRDSRKCHGDSGGPTYFDVERDGTMERRVIGITSHAYDSEDCAKGGVDTRVDAFLDWFDTQMRQACADGTRSWCVTPGIIPPDFGEPTNDGGPSDGGYGDSDGDTDGAANDGGDPLPTIDDASLSEMDSTGCNQVGGTLFTLVPLIPLLLRRRRRNPSKSR